MKQKKVEELKKGDKVRTCVPYGKSWGYQSWATITDISKPVPVYSPNGNGSAREDLFYFSYKIDTGRSAGEVFHDIKPRGSIVGIPPHPSWIRRVINALFSK